VTTLLLVRHAHTTAVGHTLAGRMPGVGLSDRGRAQLAGLATRLGRVPLDAVWTSPRERTRDTALAIVEGREVPVREDAGLDEIDYGEWTGAGIESLGPVAPWGHWNRFRSASRPPGGELALAAQARAVEAALRARDAYPDGTVAFVSHADLLRGIVAWFTGVPLDLALRLAIAPASVSVLRLGEDWARLDLLNHQGESVV
jgi:broad specificity phosphatase PhoE